MRNDNNSPNTSAFIACKERMVENFRKNKILSSTAELDSALSENPMLVLERDADSNETLLQIAVCLGHDAWANALIEKGADVNAVAESLSVLGYALSSANNKMVRLLLEKGVTAHFTHETELKSEMTLAVARGNKIAVETFSLMLSRKPEFKKLYDLCVLGEIDTAKREFTFDFTEFDETEIILKTIFMMLFNQHQFAGAKTIGEILQEYEEFKETVCSELKVETGDFKNSKWTDLKNNCDFSKYDSEKQKQLSDFFDGLGRMLGDAQRCVELLKELDAKLASAFPILSSVKPGEGIAVPNDFRFPSCPGADHQFIKTHSALTYFIIEKLRQHGICMSDAVLTFVGFVQENDANEKINTGFLFKDHWAVNQGIIHGKYTHLLHFYLIVRGIESGDITLPTGMTLHDIMKIMVDPAMTTTGESLWSVIDTVSLVASPIKLNPSDYNFGYVHRFNAFLWFCDALPHLRGCLLNSFYKSMQKLQAMFVAKFVGIQPPDYKLIAFALSVSYDYFDLFNLGIEKKDVYERLCEKNPLARFDVSSGIIYKKLPTLFQPAANSADSRVGVHLSL